MAAASVATGGVAMSYSRANAQATTPKKDEADGREDCAHEKHEGKIAALYGNNPDPQEAKGK